MSSISVTGPDGATFSFPLGTSPDVITSAMSDHYASIKATGGTQSGDEARALAAGNTRSKMPLKDIEAAYDVASGRGDDAEARRMADAYVEREHAESPAAMGVDDRVRAVARGVPIVGGAADETAAFLSSPLNALGITSGNGYQKALDYQRARDRAFDTAHPVESTVEQLGGGLASGFGLAGKAAGAISGMSPMGAIATGASAGGAIGGADAFTRGEGGAVARGQDAVVGALLGGTIGAAAPAVGGAVGSGVRKILDRYGANAELGKIGLSPEAGRILTRALDNDGSLGPRGAAAINAAGPEAMVADAGPNARVLLDTALQRQSPGLQAARDAIEARAGRAGGQIDAALDTALGAPQGVATAEQAIRDAARRGTPAAKVEANPAAGTAMVPYDEAAASAAAGKPRIGDLYDKAYATPIDYSSPQGMALEQMVKGRVPPAVIQRANALMRVEGEQSRQILAKVADDGTVTFERLPDVRQLDYITRAMNDVAQRGDGMGALGGNTAEGRAYGNLSRDLRSTLREAVPEYGAALDAAADPIRQRQALQLGEKVMSPSMARDEVAQELAGMSAAERDAVKQGIRSTIDEALANVRRAISDPNVDARQGMQAVKDLSSDAARAKLETVLGKDEAATLFRSIDEATRAFDLRASVAQNSKTAVRSITNDQLAAAVEPGPIGLAMEGRIPTAVARVFQAMTGRTPEAKQAAQDKIMGEVVQSLVSRRGPEAADFVKRLAASNDKSQAAADLGRIFGQTGGRLFFGAGTGAMPLLPSVGGNGTNRK